MTKIHKIEIVNGVESLFEINKFLNDLIRYMDLDIKWKLINFKQLELKKCYIRGVLRESHLMGVLHEYLISDLCKNNTFNKYNFFTKPYPMIHLPGDKSESTNYLHYDQEDDVETYTCWLPITKNDYEEISIFIYENPLVNFFAKIISKIKFFKIISNQLKSKFGYYYLWSGKRLHKGNLNTSNQLSCAIQMKISLKELSKEVSKKNPLKNNSFIFKNKIVSEKSYKENFYNLSTVINDLDAIKNNEFNDLVFLISKIKSLIFFNFTENNQEISFAISIFSQRIRPQYKNDRIVLFNCFCYDIASVLLGGSNTVSLFRIKNDIKFFYNNFYKEKNFKNIYEIKETLSKI